MPSLDMNRNEMLAGLAKTLSPKRSRSKFLIWYLTVRLTMFIKRLFDVAVSCMMLVFLIPVFAITALCIVLESRGPVFYSQTRVGTDGRHFRFFKFRSMVVGAHNIKEELLKHNESKDGVLFKMKKDPRVTRVGRIIRKFSIDELPQLFNVLIGDMSLVGPRPATPD
jgi:lipopolysaccharide/colanic/teichoic acid biosynthesis glycosyltransferase